MVDDRTSRADSLEADLAAWGKALILETRGRSSGLPREVTIGFILGVDEALLVSAADDTAQWAQNLIADARCVVEFDGVRSSRVAEALDGEERRSVIAELILKYGTPAERHGSGPAFRLRTI
jgi:hypothetical protein